MVGTINKIVDEIKLETASILFSADGYVIIRQKENVESNIKEVKATFKAMDKPENIEFIDTPEDIRDKYQYFTEAPMQKLQRIGYSIPFYSLEEGVKDYVENFLVEKKYW